MKILVCGDRNWDNQDLVNAVLDRWLAKAQKSGRKLEIIEGEAHGADTCGRVWAETRKVKFHPYPAAWHLYGKSAGPIRNRKMLSSQPNLVIAFHNDIENSKGTKHMVRIAKKAGITVRVVTE